MCWNEGRLCWKIAKLFYFCHLKKLVSPETFGPYPLFVLLSESSSAARRGIWYKDCFHICTTTRALHCVILCPSRWLRGGSAAVRLWSCGVLVTPGVWMSVYCNCCVLSGRGLCFGLITRPEESYRVWCVWVWSWILDNQKALAQWVAVAPWGGGFEDGNSVWVQPFLV